MLCTMCLREDHDSFLHVTTWGRIVGETAAEHTVWAQTSQSLMDWLTEASALLRSQSATHWSSSTAELRAGQKKGDLKKKKILLLFPTLQYALSHHPKTKCIQFWEVFTFEKLHSIFFLACFLKSDQNDISEFQIVAHSFSVNQLRNESSLKSASKQKYTQSVSRSFSFSLWHYPMLLW